MNAAGKMRDMILAVAKKIWENYHPERIVLFGSYACGAPNVDSDVDFLVIKDTDARPLDRWREVRDLIYEKGRGVSVQPIVMTPNEVLRRRRAGDRFIEEIMNRGEVLYERR